MYRKSLVLAASGLGSIRIARELSREFSLDISPGTIAHWIARNRRPRIRNVFEEKASSSLSYVIGAGRGDGCSLSKSGIVKLEVTDRDFAVAFNRSMSLLFSRDKPNKILIRDFGGGRKKLYIVKYSSRQLVELLKRPLDKLWKLANAYPRDFLRGFFVAEGHVNVAVGEKWGLFIAIGVSNCNRHLLLLVKRTLNAAFELHANLLRRREAGSLKIIRGESFFTRQTSYELDIYRMEDLRRFAREIGFSIGRKKRKLDDALLISVTYSRSQRASAWKRLYFKRKGKWERFKTPTALT